MKLLISAYACRPNIGSEPAVGWSWIMQLCKYHDLFVLTNFTNQKYIQEYQEKNPHLFNNITFVYVRPSKKLTFWYKEWERLERVYYCIWQRKAYQVARKLNKKEHFDCVQHLTYVTCIMPTYMHKLNIPFIYGPIAGGERIPSIIGYPMEKKDYLIELIRSLTLNIPKISLNSQRAFKHAKKIIVVTESTKKLVPPKYHYKTQIHQAISIDDAFFEPKPNFNDKKLNNTCRILIAGRMLGWKGFELGITAAKIALQKGADIDLTVLGSGSETHFIKLKDLSMPYLNDKIHFVSSVPYEEMKKFYDSFDLLLNCSLRDSGCLVVMESMSRGLPVICVNTGGPQVNTTSDTAIKIDPKPFQNMAEEIAQALIDLAEDSLKRYSLAQNSYEYACENFSISNKINNFLYVYDEVVKSEENLENGL